MINININAIGKEKCLHMQSLQLEYIRKTNWKIKINEYVSKLENTDTFLIQEDESKLISQNISKKSKTFVLDETGKEINSVEFSNILKANLEIGIKDYFFLIGGPYGYTVRLKSNKNYQLLSLSKLTFPHKLVRLILIEQLYRAYTLLIGYPYHKF